MTTHHKAKGGFSSNEASMWKSIRVA